MHTHRTIYEQRVKKNLKASLKEIYKVAYEYVVHVSFLQEREEKIEINELLQRENMFDISRTL